MGLTISNCILTIFAPTHSGAFRSKLITFTIIFFAVIFFTITTFGVSFGVGLDKKTYFFSDLGLKGKLVFSLNIFNLFLAFFFTFNDILTVVRTTTFGATVLPIGETLAIQFQTP